MQYLLSLVAFPNSSFFSLIFSNLNFHCFCPKSCAFSLPLPPHFSLVSYSLPRSLSLSSRSRSSSVLLSMWCWHIIVFLYLCGSSVGCWRLFAVALSGRPLPCPTCVAVFPPGFFADSIYQTHACLLFYQSLTQCNTGSIFVVVPWPAQERNSRDGLTALFAISDSFEDKTKRRK